MLQFDRVYKTYNQQPVLDISHLKLERNIYWLKGINGSGKTTLLSILAGLIPFPPDPVYDASKHAVVGLIRSVPLIPRAFRSR